ncbi:MAG: type II toxin-antitoxin system VapC family toxin [bacterium]|nr:type II toxin-antitoxin system VapC family toxin [bacterium]
MRILLDTCTFLWIITNDPKLSLSARETFVNPDNRVFLSAVSSWEIVVKYNLGRLPLPEPPEKFIPGRRKQHEIESLPLDEETTLHLAKLPDYHKDPFDRMIVCQALIHGLIILTPDEAVQKYPVRTIW